MIWFWIIGLYFAGAIVFGKIVVWADKTNGAMTDEDDLALMILFWPIIMPLALCFAVMGFVVYAVMKVVKKK